MPVKIRLMRIGAKKRPFYRVVAVDERKKRTGGYLENLGTYNPLTEPKEIILKQDRIDEWLKKGAVLSDGYLRIIGKAPQRLPRAPKKQKKEAPAPVEAVAPVEEPTKTDEVAAPETPAEETPTEEITPEAVETQEVSENQPTNEVVESTPEPTETPTSESKEASAQEVK